MVAHRREAPSAVVTKSLSLEHQVGATPGLPKASPSIRNPLFDDIRNAQRIGDDGQRRIDCSNRWKEARVRHIEILEFMRLAVKVQNGGVRVRAKARGPGLMRRAP